MFIHRIVSPVQRIVADFLRARILAGELRDAGSERMTNALLSLCFPRPGLEFFARLNDAQEENVTVAANFVTDIFMRAFSV